MIEGRADDAHPLELLVALVDGTLPPAATAAVTGHVRGCQVCGAEILDLLVAVTSLRDAGQLRLPEPSEVPPPDLDRIFGAEPALVARAAATRAAATRPTARRPVSGQRPTWLRRSGRRRPLPGRDAGPPAGPSRALALVAAAGALVAGLAIGLEHRGAAPTVRGPQVSATVVLSPLLYGPNPVRVVASAAMLGAGPTRRMRVTVAALAPAAPGDYYELWLLDTRSGRTVPIGVLPGDGVSIYPLPEAEQAGFDAIDVSVQQRTGSGAHSGDSVLRGQLG